MRSILHVINGIERGGAEQVVLELVRNRDAGEFEAIVAYLFGEEELRPELERAGARVVRLGLRRSWEAPLAAGRLASLIARERPAVVHTHLLHAEILGGFVGRALRRPVVGTAHNVCWEDPMYPRPLRALYRHTLRTNDWTVAISQIVRDRVLAAGVAPERVSIVANGIGPVAYLERAAARRRLGVPEAAQLVGAIGNLYWYKGHDLLLDAFLALAPARPSLELVLVGDGPKRGELEARAERAGLRSRVHLPGRIAAAATLLRGLDVYVQPSRTEGFGLALLEAMAAGVPTVARAVEGILEVAGPEPASLLVPPEPADALAGAIARVLDDAALRDRLAGLGPARAAQFGAGAMTREYERVYRLLAGSGEPRSFSSSSSTRT